MALRGALVVLQVRDRLIADVAELIAALFASKCVFCPPLLVDFSAVWAERAMSYVDSRVLI